MLLLLMYSLVWSIPRAEGQFEEENKEYMGLYIGSLNSYHHQVSLEEYKEYMRLNIGSITHIIIIRYHERSIRSMGLYIGSLNLLEEYQEYKGLYIGSLNSYHHQVSLEEYQEYMGLYIGSLNSYHHYRITRSIWDYTLDP